jgi:precorrin-2 C20-methyltransferase / precorrin-3B C17-methyltransferase
VVGRLYGVGLGPGDPELVTVKAARLIGAADVIAFHSARHGRSIARGIAAPYRRDGQIEEALVYPVTTETTDHPGGYRGALEDFYAAAAARLAAHLDAGRDVAVLCEGDPFFYGSYMHMHKRLAHRYETVVVPGVTSIAGAAAELGRPLVEAEETLTVLPGTLPPAELASRLAAADSAAVMKLGRTFGNVRDALESAGRLDDAWYVERATTDQQRIVPLRDVDPSTVPYFSVALLPSRVHATTAAALADSAASATATATAAGTSATATAAATSATAAGPDMSAVAPVSGPSVATVVPGMPEKVAGHGRLTVVGLGPAGREWTTPQAQAALGEATDLVGYGPYLDRIPANPRQTRHPSDNRVESERAEFALTLAARGRRVAVVSSGDPGVFAMASAVLEVAATEPYTDIPVTVLPGLTAAQAVASRVGAPLGHDYAVISLSDRLKPWDVIEERLTAAARADLVIAIYNPASKSRTWQVEKARDLLLEHRTPDTPVVLGRDVGGAGERVTVVRLADLTPGAVDMRTLLIIGSSRTRHVNGTVFTPRRYPTNT